MILDVPGNIATLKDENEMVRLDICLQEALSLF
jgi:hypothetical protein